MSATNSTGRANHTLLMTSPSRVEIDGCSPPYRHSKFPAGSLRYASRQELIKLLDERGEVFGLNGVRVVLVKLVRVRVVVASALRSRPRPWSCCCSRRPGSLRAS